MNIIFVINLTCTYFYYYPSLSYCVESHFARRIIDGTTITNNKQVNEFMFVSVVKNQLSTVCSCAF